MTIDLRSGIKIYDNDWFIRFGWEPEQLADYLVSLNLSYVIAQSRFLPMDNSAVQSSVTAADRARYAKLDDVALRNLLRERGIAYIAVENICFDPTYAAEHPEDLPIDQFGVRHQQVDWYVGVPPDRKANIAQKAERLKAAVDALDPDGVHLGFIRWPGFWETWLPGESRSDKPEYCFDPQTIAAFNDFAGLALDPEAGHLNAPAIFSEHRADWTRYKCETTREAIRSIRAVVEAGRVPVPVSINTVPMFQEDFGHAVTEVFGQDWTVLRDVVDTFEVMTYHQIVRQDAAWPAAVAEHIRKVSGQAAIATVQASPLYLEGMHTGMGRNPTLDAEEFSRMLDPLETAEIEGICVFTLTELMNRMDSEDGRAIGERLSGFRQ